jgi:serine/threonine protein kinase
LVRGLTAGTLGDRGKSLVFGPALTTRFGPARRLQALLSGLDGRVLVFPKKLVLPFPLSKLYNPRIMPSIALSTTFIGPNNETFKTLDFLDSGAFGEVYRAVGETSGTIVAIKLLPIGELSSNESRIALLNEVRAAQQIKHPNVVQVLSVNDGSSSQIGPYVVMEYVSGGSLAKLLKKQEQSRIPLPLDRAVAMMIGLAQGARANNTRRFHQAR